MFFAPYPSSEAITALPYLYCFNGSYHYSLETNIIPRTAMHASNNTKSLKPSTIILEKNPSPSQNHGYFNVLSDAFQQGSCSNYHRVDPILLYDNKFATSPQAGINSRIVDCHGGTVPVSEKFSETNSQPEINRTIINCHGSTASVLDTKSCPQIEMRTRIDDCSGATTPDMDTKTCHQTGVNSRFVDCRSGTVPVIESKTSPKTGITDCRSGTTPIMDKFYETNSQSAMNRNIRDRLGGTLPVLDTFSKTNYQAVINKRVVDCCVGTYTVSNKYSDGSSRSGISPRTVSCHSGTDSFSDKHSETSSQAEINSRTVDCHGGRINNSKSSEIWRPFCTSPRKELSAVGIGTFQQHIPSRTKIEHSKTSPFKPVKKRDYKCSYCSSSFASSAQLISHLRVHTGSKPFHCAHCRKRFARNEELTRHLRIHSGYKPHACRSCGKAFGRKDHLAKHAKTHLHPAEKRAYACPMPGCEHRYTRSDALTRHKTSAHATWRQEGESRRM